MAFDAGKVAEALDWSWRPYVDLSGTVPEPTDDEIRTMNRKLRDATVKVTGEDYDATNPAEVARIFRKLTDEQLKQMHDDNLKALAVVTKNSPSLEELQTAPARVARFFMRWLIQELNAPEGKATATTP